MAAAVDTLAVGTYEELPEVANRYAGDLLVLTPWRPFHPTPDAALAGRVIHTVSRPDDLAGLLEAQPGARFVLELRDLDAPARHDRPAAVGDSRSSSAAAALEGVALHLPLASGPPPRRGRAAAHRPGRRGAPDQHRLGQPPDRRRAGHPPRVVRRPHRPAPHRHRPVARRPRGAAGHRDGPRRARAQARRRVRLPRPQRTARRPPAGRQRRHRARHRPRVADGRDRPQGPRRGRGPRRHGRDGADPLAVLGRRQAAALRRAAAHAGLDAVPAQPTPRCPRWATASTSGCATPRRRSTASTS